MPDDKKFEDALMKILEHGKFDKSRLSSISSAISDMKKNGFTIDRLHWIGVPVIDRIFVYGIPAPEFWGRFNANFTFHQINEVKLFPYGIINPEGWRAEVEIGI